jgi:glycosyltransferase involved in cell wall biosynthesis
MKIALVGPGIMPIPPPGWGAVEILIWDYALVLRKMGHEVDILNEIRSHPGDQSGLHMPYCQRLVEKVNSGDYDFVHVHYDCLFHLLPFFVCPKIGITSHYPYIDQPEKHRGDGYADIFQGICQNQNHVIFALSQKDYSMFEKFCHNKKKLFLAFNGANSTEITPTINPNYGDRSIYLGKIESRKKQIVYSSIPGIDYYGKCENTEFQKLSCYKGEIEGHQKMMDILSQYGNLVLLSDGENGTPLVIKEALMAGLPVVTNQYSSNDLDVSLPFIDIIPNDKLQDLNYIQQVIEENRGKQTMKEQIRQYAEDHFSWNVLVKKYIDFIDSL